jgi:hypothetical protein
LADGLMLVFQHPVRCLEFYTGYGQKNVHSGHPADSG